MAQERDSAGRFTGGGGGGGGSGGGGGGVLRELLAVFGFGVDTKALGEGQNKLNEFLKGVKEVAEGIAAAFAVEQIYEFAEGQARAMNAIERTASMIGISTERVQEFQFAAKSMGLDINAVTDSISRMQVAQQMAAEGSKEQAEAFGWVGASVKDTNGKMKDADALFLDVADGIAKMTDPAKQAAAAQYIFGRSGRVLLPFLKEGRAGAEEYFKTFRELGGGYSEDAIKAGKDFDKQQAKTGLALLAVKNMIAKSLLPIITKLSAGVQHVVTWFHNLTKDSHIVRAALITLAAAAAPFAIEMAVAAAPLLLIAAALAAVVLAVDDLYTFLTGGESEIGDLLDKIFGKGTQESALKSVKDAWASIKDTFRTMAPYVKDVWDAFKWFVENAGALGDAAAKMGIKAGENAYENDEGGLRTKRHQSDILRQRIEAVKNHQIFRAPGESMEQAKLAAQVVERQFLTPSVDRTAPLVASGGNGGVHVDHLEIHQQPGEDGKQLAERFMKHVHEANKQDRRAAAATLPRAGS